MEDKEDSSSGEEEVMEVEGTSMSGVVEFIKDGKKAKPHWFLLLGSSLFEYKSVLKEEPVSATQLKGADIINKEKSSEIEIKKDGKLLLTLLLDNEEIRNRWIKALKEASTKEPQEKPVRIVGKKGTLTSRMKKTIAGKVATSSAAKFVAKSSIPEDVTKLVNSLKAILISYYGEKDAVLVEDNIIKIYVKWVYLENDDLIPPKIYNQLESPLRKSFDLITKLRDATTVRKKGDEPQITENIKVICKTLREAEVTLTDLLSPLLKPKSVQRVGTIFKYLAQEEFLMNAIVAPLVPRPKPFLEEEIDDLCIAMDKFLSIHVYDS